MKKVHLSEDVYAYLGDDEITLTSEDGAETKYYFTLNQEQVSALLEVLKKEDIKSL
jgi:hypothetical protein